MASISTLPKYESEQFMRWLAEAAEKYFENPENQKRFEQWKKERDNNATHQQTVESNGAQAAAGR